MATTSPNGGTGTTSGTTPTTTKPPAKTAAKPAPAPAPAAASAGQGYLSFAQLEALAMKAGATSQEAVTLAAIAMAESSGNSGSLNNNPSTGDLSYGLWQINMLGQMGPDRMQQFGLPSYDALFDPLTNAKAAVALLRANNGYNDWSTFKSGAYSQYVPDAQAAIGQAPKVNVATIQPSPIPQATVGGQPAGGALGTPPDQTVSDYLGNPDIAASYGYLAAYMKDPEIGPILAKAAQKGWNSGELLSALQKTHWWQTMSDTKRQMQALQREDPASYKQQVANKTAQVSALAASMGLNIGGKQLQQIATTSLWSNWSDLQLQEAVGSEFKYQPGKAVAGTAGADIQQFKAMADAYMVPLSNQTLDQWTRSALEGKINPKDYTGYLAQQAKTLFPWMSHAIDSGIDPNTYLDPYRQAAAKTLELDPNQINFMDPKWMSLFQAVDPKTGQRSELGLANAMTKMRTDPRYGYDRTQGARQDAASFAASLAHQFGFTGTDSAFSGVSQQGL